MLSVLQGPGLKPSEGAEPTEPSDKAGSVPDRESVLSKASEEDRGIGNLIYNKIKKNQKVLIFLKVQKYVIKIKKQMGNNGILISLV